MTGFRRANLSAALFATIVVTVVACGGSSATPTPTPVGEATPPPAGEATPAPAGEVTPTPEPTPAGEATPGDVIPSIDLGALTGAIPGVDSYRTSFSVNGVEQYQTVVVTKPVLSKAITTLNDGVVGTRFIVIGAETWTAEGADGTFAPVPAALASSLLFAFDPALMLGAYTGLDLGQAASDQGVESKNGVQARHLRIDPTTFAGLAGAMPPGSAIDIWVADAGYLVAWEMTGFEESGDVSIQVTGVNDAANKVDRPS
jgi:hypothetical protein